MGNGPIPVFSYGSGQSIPKNGEAAMKRRSLLFGLALLFVSLSLAAQDNASLTGTVKDSSGASVPNANVVVTSSEKGVTRQLTSNTQQ